MILNRKIQPSPGSLKGLEFRLPESIRLSSGARLHILDEGTEDVCRVEWVFWNGSWNQTKKLQSYSSIKMLPEGAAGRSSHEIAELVQFHGAYLDERSNHHNSSITLYSLTKHLPRMIELVRELLLEPDFPEAEFKVMMNQSLQEYRVESEKVVSIARRQFNALIFGSAHPYGSVLTEADYESIGPQDARAFHQIFHGPADCDIIVAGKVHAGFIDQMELNFGRSWTVNQTKVPVVTIPELAIEAQQVYLPKPGALQCAIRIGRTLFTRNHPDYHLFSILNTMLGGYFGSRLMSNLREDKGYTYGVGSGNLAMKYAGAFFISSQVASEHWEDAVKQIKVELMRLIEEEISQSELDLVRNYLWGNIARAYDGPFARAERLRTYLEFGLDASNLDQYLEVLKSATPYELREMASKYLNPNSMTELVVGP